MQHFALSRTGVILLLLAILCTHWAWSANVNKSQPWETIDSSDGSYPTPRHEAAAVVVDDQMFLIGGRGIRPVDRYDSLSGTWHTLAAPAAEIHHFQPLLWRDQVYLLGGFYCCYPNEPSFTHIQVYDPLQDSWAQGAEIPQARRRGGAAAVLYNEKMYMLGGNNQGHNGGAVAWFDEYDPLSDEWRTLPDAPTARDHFSAVMIGSKLIAVGGRQSTQPNPFLNTVDTVDIYDFATGQWTTADEPIPTRRAGAMVVTHGSEVIVIGGEIADSAVALDVVEAFDVDTGRWRSLQSLQQARHSGGAGIVGDYLHVASGGQYRGGGGELSSHERLLLEPLILPPVDSDVDGLSDIDENTVHNTDAQDADSDDDTLDDGREVRLGTDPNNADSDQDELGDGEEVSRYLTDPLLADTDDDGLTDGNEVKVQHTDPRLADSDADGLNDGIELARGLNPLLSDSDEDGLDDLLEIASSGSDPLLYDTDGDGLSDGDEYLLYKTDPTLADTDGDGLNDLLELDSGLNPLDTDSDHDGISDYDELNAVDPRSDSGSGGGALLGLLLILVLFSAALRPSVLLARVAMPLRRVQHTARRRSA